MDTLDHPCGCSYQLDRDGNFLFPATRQCAEHRIVSEMAATVAEAGMRIRREQDGNQPA